MEKSSKKLRDILVSKHFKLSFRFIFILGTIIYLIACSGAFLQFYSTSLREIEADANKLSSTINETIQTAKSNAVFTGSVKSIRKALSSTSPSIDILTDVVSDLSALSDKSYYEAVNLFLGQSQKVYVSGVGMYSYEDYFDQDLLKLLKENKKDSFWIVDMDYSRYYGDQYPLNVLTYVKRLPIFEYDKTGYVSINIPMQYIQKSADAQRVGSLHEAVASFDNKLIYSSNLELYNKYDSSKPLSENLDSFFVSKRPVYSTSQNEVDVVYFIDNQSIFKELLKEIPLYILLYTGLIIAVFFCAFIYSYIMVLALYDAIRRSNKPDDIKTVNRKPDEFNFLSSTFDNLNEELLSIQENLLSHKPLLQERFINEILCSHMEINDKLDEYKQYDISFPFEYFCVVLVYLPDTEKVYNHTISEQLRLVVRQNCIEKFSSLGKAYCTYVENNGIAFLINTNSHESLTENLKDLCHSVSGHLNELFNVNLSFSVGICSKENPIPYRAYVQAKKNMMFASTDSDQFIPIGIQNEYVYSIDEKLIDDFLSCILERSISDLRKHMTTFKQVYLTSLITLQQAKNITEIFICQIFSKLIDSEIEASPLQISEYIMKLDNAATVDECENLMYSYFAGEIRAGDKIPEEAHVYIKKAIEYMEQYYMKNISIPDIAEYISINSIYLNKLFKLSTGKTISDYLNFYRIERSKDMLVLSNEPINIISELVGYNDTRSYIRFFKKFYDTTPNVYRKDHRQK